MTGFDAANLSLAGAGLTGTIGAPTTADNLTWTVAVSGVSGTGTLGVNVDQGIGSIIDSLGNPMSVAFTTGEVFAVDQDAPTVVSILRSNANPTNATAVGYTVQFSEVVSGLSPANFSLTGAGVTGVIGTPATSDGITWTVSITAVAGNGTLGLDLDQTLASIVDDTTNPLAAGLTGEVYTVDQAAPTVVSITRSGSSPTNATTLGFTIQFSEAVSGLTAASFSPNGAGVTGTIGAPITSDGITWQVEVTGVAGSGTLGLDLTNGAGVADAVGNVLAGLPSVGELYAVDQSVPTVVSLVRADASPTNATTLNFIVTFSEAVTGVDAANLSLASTGVTGSISTPTSGDGGVTWNVLVTGVAGDGTLGMDLTDASGIGDSTGNALAGTFTGEVYTVDQTAPTVSSFTRNGSNPSSATSVDFTLVFTEPVSGLAAANFALAGAGSTGTIGVPTSGDGGLTWTIPVAAVTGDGTLGLTLQDGTSVVDPAGNALAGAPIASELYTIDQTAPAVVSLERAGASPTNATTLGFVLTFSEPVSGVDASAFTLTGAGVAGTIDTISTNDSGLTWDVSVISVAGDGTLGVDLTNGAGITDASASNPANVPFVGEVYQVDQTAPQVVSVVRAAASPTAAPRVYWTVTFTEPVAGLTASNFTLAPSGLATSISDVTTADGLTWTVTAVVSGTGTVGLDVTDGTGVTDPSGNVLTGLPINGETYTVNQPAPVVLSITRADTDPTNATTVNFTVTFNEAVTGVTAGAFSLNVTGTSGFVGTPTTADDITWNVPVSLVSGDGTLGLELTNETGIQNSVSTQLVASPYTGEIYTIDQTAPTIVSFQRAGTNPTNAASLTFTVTFDEAVANVTPANFTLNAAGVTGTISNATAIGDGTAWSIAVTGVAGDGSLGLDLSAPAGIADLAGNALATTLVGEVYDVDQTAPAIASITRLDTDPTNATTVRFAAAFSEAVSGISAANFALATVGVTAIIGTPSTNDGGVTWEVLLSSVNGDGTVGLDLVDATGVADTAGNGLTGAPLTGEVYNIDQTAPAVSSFTRVHATPTNASVLSFQVVFSEPVTALPIAALQVSGSGVTATITAPASTDGGLTWDIPLMDVAGDGTLSLTIADGTLVTDSAGNNLLGTPAISDEYTIDQTPPAVVSIVRAGTNPTNATTAEFTITFNEAVSGVDALDLALSATGVTGAIDTPSTSDGGITWSVNVNTVAGDGAFGLDVTGTSITDAAGNDLAFVPVTGEQYTVDQTAPQVTSLTRAGANPSNAASVSFTLVFDEAVTGLTAANLGLTGAGVSATIDAPTTSDGITWTVVLSSVSGSGTLGVDVLNGTGVADLASNALTVVPFVGELYTIDQQAPTITSIARMDVNPTNAASVRWLVTFSEAVAGVSAANFSFAGAGVTAAMGAATTNDGGVTWEITATTVAGDGTLQLDLADASGIADAGGTALATATFAGEAYDIDQTNPTVQAITLLDPNPTNATSLNYGISFSEPVTGLTAAAFTFSGTGVTATFGVPTTSDGITWTVPVTSVSGNGTLGIDMVDGSLVLDTAGNVVAGLPYWGPAYTTDQNPPSILSIVRQDPNPTNATSLTFLLTFSEHITGITPANLHLSGTGVTGTIGWPVIIDTNTWAVTVESVTGDGTLGLDLVDPTGITGDIGNPLTNTLVGELYDVDQTAPTVISIIRTDANPTNAASVGFSVVFSEPVNGVAVATFALSGSGVTGTIGAPTTSDNITWSVQVTGVAGSGTLGLDIPVGTAVTDVAGNPLTNALAGEQYDVDQDAPVVQSIVRTDANPTNAATLNFLVTFSDAVSGVAAGNFTLSGTGVSGTMGAPATSDGGITWTIAVTGVTGAGTLGVDLTSGAGITDSLGNPLANTLVGEQYTIDQVAPTIVSITRTDTNPTNAATLGFLATFDEPVSGVTAVAFALTGTSGTGTIGTPTTTDGGLTWQIPVTGVSANGTLGLDLVVVTGIVDQTGQTLQNTMIGEQYTIVQDPPTVDSITRTDANPTNATTLGFTVVFSKVVMGVTAANFTLSGSGVTATIGMPTTADGVTWTVQLTTVAGTGTIGLDLSDATGITDGVGNPLANTLAGEQYDVDQTAPEVSAINLLDTNPTTAASVNFEVVFTEAVTGFNTANLALSGGGVTATINPPTTTDNITWNVNLTLTGGSGTIGIDVVDGTGVTDAVGNVLANPPFVGPTYTVCPVLPAPVNPVPADFATTHSQISMLTWDSVPGATHYDVYLDGVLTSSTTEAYVLTAPPLAGGLHQWRVDVLDSCSVTTGNTWTFNVLDAVENPTPGEGNRQCESPAQFTWPAAVGATSYIVILDGVQVAFTSNTYWDVAPPLAQGTHTWQLISVNAWGNVASQTWTFQILPSGMVDPNLWRPVGQVHAIVAQGNIMYIGGNFNYIRSPDGTQVKRRDYLAAIDLTTGQPTDWTGNANNVVHAVAISGNTLYAGGTFSQMNGLNRNRLAAIDVTTSNVLNWAPEPNGVVRAIAADASGVFVGGDFTSIGGVGRSRLAQLNRATDGPASVLPWNPAPDQPVHALLGDSTHMYVGGTFNLIGGLPLHGIAAVARDTGAAVAWPHTGADLYVYALARQGNTLYAGGFFNTMGGLPRKNLAALDLTTGNVTAWNPGPDRAVTTIATTPSTIYLGGFFDTVAGQTRRYVAMISTITGQTEPCTFDTNNVVRALGITLNVLFAGGDFSLVSNNGVMGFAAFGSLNISPPQSSSVVGWEKY